MSLTIFSGMPYAYRNRSSLFLFTESKAFLKIMAGSFWWFLVSSMMRLRGRICDDVEHMGLNSFWLGRKIFVDCKLCNSLY